ERGDDDTGVGGRPREAAIAPDDAEHVRADRPGEFQSTHEVHRYVARHIAAAHGEAEHGVAGTETRAAEPFHAHGHPALAVRTRGQLRHVVSGGVCLEAAQLAKIVHRMASVAGRASHTEHEEPAAGVTHTCEAGG